MKISNIFPKIGGRPQWALSIPDHIYEKLHAHLFPGDHDEHAAIIKASVQNDPEGLRLLAREVVLAKDGTDFVPSPVGYRMLTAEFITDRILECKKEGLSYLAIHNHGGYGSVDFSPVDLSSHKKGYPALLDILAGAPVGALVFANNAIAGSLWVSKKTQMRLKFASIIGTNPKKLYPAPPKHPSGWSENYDRQTRIFGDRGQNLLKGLNVGVIGTGGVGSLTIEFLARLGVGKITAADPDRIEISNVPRVIGSTKRDALEFLTKPSRPEWMRRLGRRLSKPKVDIMRRVIRRANPTTQAELIMGDICVASVAKKFTKCDYIFLAADTYQARLVFNAIVHAYLIPGVDVGSKVPVDKDTGAVGDIRCVVNTVVPSKGCLLCNGYIPPAKLQMEMESAAERKQRYVEDEEVIAPSVITLNALAASHAVNDFLFTVTNLTHDKDKDYLTILPRSRKILLEVPRKGNGCPHCGNAAGSIFALGDNADLPTKSG